MPVMDALTIPSTFVITSLLAVGLFFFLRASGKDRTETRIYTVAQPFEPEAVPQFLRSLAYDLEQVDADGTAQFGGDIRPSWFLTVLLSGLATLGLACLVLVLRMVGITVLGLWGIVAFAPLAGKYYRDRNQGHETLWVKMTLDDDTTTVLVKGHRDALDTLATHFNWQEG